MKQPIIPVGVQAFLAMGLPMSASVQPAGSGGGQTSNADHTSECRPIGSGYQQDGVRADRPVFRGTA